jgi:hypothetical protein
LLRRRRWLHAALQASRCGRRATQVRSAANDRRAYLCMRAHTYSHAVLTSHFISVVFTVYAFGAPGAGKRSHCERLAKDAGLVRLTPAACLAAEQRSGSPLGEQLIEHRQQLQVGVSVTCLPYLAVIYHTLTFYSFLCRWVQPRYARFWQSLSSCQCKHALSIHLFFYLFSFLSYLTRRCLRICTRAS